MGMTGVLVQNVIGRASSNPFFVTPKIEYTEAFGAFMVLYSAILANFESV